MYLLFLLAPDRHSLQALEINKSILIKSYKKKERKKITHDLLKLSKFLFKVSTHVSHAYISCTEETPCHKIFTIKSWNYGYLQSRQEKAALNYLPRKWTFISYCCVNFVLMFTTLKSRHDPLSALLNVYDLTHW